MSGLEQLPFRILYAEIVPRADIYSLMRLTQTCRTLYFVIHKHEMWREAVQKAFPKEYAKLYSQMPKELPFFRIFTAELKLKSLADRKEIVDKMNLTNLCIIAVTTDVLAFFVIIRPAYYGLSYLGAKIYSGVQITIGETATKVLGAMLASLITDTR